MSVPRFLQFIGQFHHPSRFAIFFLAPIYGIYKQMSHGRCAANNLEILQFYS